MSRMILVAVLYAAAAACMMPPTFAQCDAYVPRLTVEDAGPLAAFGSALSVSQGVAVIGAFGDDHAGLASGSAYVYRLLGTDWTQEQKLTASDATAVDFYGLAVSICGDVVVVGAHGGTQWDMGLGAAYVYRFNGTNWVEEQVLSASDEAEGDRFGKSVSVSF